MLITVTASSDPQLVTHPLPWSYTEDAFINWVDEVFREGYKRNNPPMTLEEAIGVAESFGLTIGN